VHHHRAADDAVGPSQRDLRVRHRHGRHSVSTGGDVAQVTCVALLVTRAAVRLASRVEVRACNTECECV
jgi:hypothetical protein